MRKKIVTETKTNLTASLKFQVKFREVDSMKVVWHGNYAQYFEDAREFFGQRYGISFKDVMDEGFFAPIVELTTKYKQALLYGDWARVDIRFLNTEAAKIIFEYEIYRIEETDSGVSSLMATGRSVQVFVDTSHRLILTNPSFFHEWKKKHGLL